MSENPVWERLPDETSAAYAAFCIYRDMGNVRSMDAAYQKQQENNRKTAGKTPRHWFGWSSGNKWVERATAFDAHLDEKRRADIEAAQKEVIDNALSDYRHIRKTITKRLQTVEASNYGGAIDDIKSLVDLIRKTDDIGRRAVGLPDRISESKTEHSGSITWEQVVKEAQEDVDNSDPYA